MDLGVTIVTACNAVVRPCGLDLFVFYSSEFKTLFFVSGLEEAAASAAAIVIGPVGLHIDKIFFAHNGFDHKTQIFSNGITKTFSDDLAGILYSEFYLQVFIPVGIDL
jgi:hypothetical protein